MTNLRTPGPVCSIHDAGTHRRSNDGFAPPNATYAQPGPVRQDGRLTPEQEELALDIAQLALDIVGIFEPTPFADGTNALISIARGDWLGAGLSAVSILPYLGDLAKVGKLPKYAMSIRKAIDIAHTDANFAKRIEPALRKIKELIDDLPTDGLPEAATQQLASIQNQIGSFLKSAKATDGPITKAIQSLPQNLRGVFDKALQLPPAKNPRPLKKRPGPVNEDTLTMELRQKGFVRVKEGTHPKAGGGGAEDSDIWLRRVRDNGQDKFEAVRIDRAAGKVTGKPSDAALSGKAGATDKPFRRQHHAISETTRDAAAVGAGKKTNMQDLNDHLTLGGRKGDFSHWHHEKFDATPENLSRYLKPPKKPKDRLVPEQFDPVGQPLDTRRKTKDGKLHPTEQQKLKDELKSRHGT